MTATMVTTISASNEGEAGVGAGLVVPGDLVHGKPVANATTSKTYGKIVLTLDNVLIPADKLSPTPSALDGLDPENEMDLRNLGCELIQTSGILLKLPQTAMATGQVLFQRFYYSKSFVRQSMETTAMACVYLASKIEEAPRRIRDVINVFHHIKQVRANNILKAEMLRYTISEMGRLDAQSPFDVLPRVVWPILVQLRKRQLSYYLGSGVRKLSLRTACRHCPDVQVINQIRILESERLFIEIGLCSNHLGLSNGVYSNPDKALVLAWIGDIYTGIIQPLVLDSAYIRLKSDVTLAERRVLKELGFCVHVKHPHKLIVIYLRYLGFETNTTFIQLSWNYMNDSLRTNVFVRFTPETIACACIYLSARKLRIPLPLNPPWYAVFDTVESDLVDICESILILYERPKVNIEKLEKVIDTLSRAYQDTKTKAKLAVSASASPATMDRNAQNVPSPITISSRQSSPKLPENPPVKLKESEEVSRKRHGDDQYYDDEPNGGKYKRDRERDRERDRDRERSPVAKKSRRTPSPISYNNSPPRHKHKKRKKTRYSSSGSRSRSRSRSRHRDRRDKKKSHRHERSRSPYTPPKRHHHSSKKSGYRERDRDRY